MNEISQEEVLRLFRYEDGYLIRRVTVKGNAKRGDTVGCANGKGYLVVSVNGNSFRVHRLIFLYHKGYLPKIVDHDDVDTLNNKIGNLRGCNSSENSMNAKIGENNTSGVKGVCLNIRNNKWRAEIKVNYKQIYIGEYVDINDAARAVRMERIKHHGEFANHG